MQIKRFEAKNMTDALRQIKRELGSEAVILSAKDLRRENRLLGISRKIGVEVTAAVDEEHPGLVNNSQENTARRRPGKIGPMAPQRSAPVRPGRSLVNHINDIVRLKKTTQQPHSLATTPDSSDLPLEASPPYGNQRPDSMPLSSHASHGETMERYLKKSGLSVGTLTLNEAGTTFVSLVGNAGVGKTSTIAKMAALFKYNEKASVGFLALDSRRVGGIEQLQCFADGMDLPLAAPVKEGDLDAALARLKSCRIVLVDTPAVNPRDENCLTKLKSQLNAIPGVIILLAVSAESREEDLADTRRRYAPLKPSGTIITKSDLTHSYRDLFNFLCRGNLPVYYYSSGPCIPLDLKKATIEELAKRFLQEASGRTENATAADEIARSAPAEDDDEHLIYLANKSSDIFHRPDCKWIRLINRANIMEFNSFAEALNHRYKPCRYCNPQHISIAGILSKERAVL